MNKKIIFYHVYSGTMNPCCLTKELYAIADETWCCTGCKYPNRGVKAVDVTIQDNEIENRPINVVMGCGIPIAKREFLFSFGKNIVEKDLYLGKVFAENGSIMEDWITYRGKRKVIIRGTKHAAFGKCEKCGRNCYFAMGSRYLYPEPAQDTLLFESDLCGLVFHEELYNKINLGRVKKFIIDKLPVLEYPKDGFVELTSFYADGSDS